MLKQSLLYLILSVLIIIFAQYVHIVMIYINVMYTFITLHLAPLFSQGSLGFMIRQLLTLMALPLLLASLPALIYRGIKGKTMPYFIETTWILWIILVFSQVIVH